MTAIFGGFTSKDDFNSRRPLLCRVQIFDSLFRCICFVWRGSPASWSLLVGTQDEWRLAMYACSNFEVFKLGTSIAKRLVK
mmetsp:Transcript_20389/g.39715  ORF Transcript_20389/g.39715 Transcript_20389/m.39715 type:complete len:81 (-) Transcript_20389:224-466(-)